MLGLAWIRLGSVRFGSVKKHLLNPLALVIRFGSVRFG